MFTKNRVLVFFLVFLALTVNGCVGVDFGATLRGDYLLYGKKYAQGVTEFKERVAQDSPNANTYYYLGRFLLAQKESDPQVALPNFQKAVSLSPANSTYLFWQGVAYGAVNKPEKEREIYLQILLKNKRNIQALTYLGHNQLRAGELEDALVSYEKVLKIWPLSPAALFNRGFIAHKMGKAVSEKKAWLEYLDVYPSGAMARRAVDYLNRLGEFQYRNQRLGARTLTTEKVSFEPFSDKIRGKSQPSLNLIGSVFAKMKKSELHVLVYAKGEGALAKKRAKSIKKYILGRNKKIMADSIKISWFAVAEEIKVSGGKTLTERESVSFFSKRM